MAARKDPSQGGKPDKLMRDALMLALKREAKDCDGKKTKKINIIAAKLVDLACAGDVAAIKEVADRTDGKPAQAVALSAPDGGPVSFKTVYEKRGD